VEEDAVGEPEKNAGEIEDQHAVGEIASALLLDLINCGTKANVVQKPATAPRISMDCGEGICGGLLVYSSRRRRDGIRKRPDRYGLGGADRKTQAPGALLAPGARAGRVFSNAHCIFVKVPAPDSAWQAPDTVELRVRILASGSDGALHKDRAIISALAAQFQFRSGLRAGDFHGMQAGGIGKLAVPESWFASPPKSKLRMTCTGMRSLIAPWRCMDQSEQLSACRSKFRCPRSPAAAGASGRHDLISAASGIAGCWPGFP